MAWFPVFAELIERQEFKRLTPTEKLYFWHLVSNFNLKGEFYQSDLEIAVTLAVSVETIRRARRKLTKMGLIEVRPGKLSKRKHCLATRYLGIRYVTMNEEGFFAQIPRYTFEAMLHHLRKSTLKHGDVVTHVILSYWFWRNQGKYENRDQFYITKKELQSLTNLPDAAKSVQKIYEAFVFSDGSHLFEYSEKHHHFLFKKCFLSAELDKIESNLSHAERRLKEVKDLVAREKQKRQINAQKKMVAMIPKKSKAHVPPLDLILVFEKLYGRRYGRRPNLKGEAKIHTLEQESGREAIYRAMQWYFTADSVPKGTGVKTRTLGNFVCQIEEILKLSAQFKFSKFV